MPANDALFGFCQKLRKERETMQPSLRVPTVLSTCKMEKTFFDSLRVKNFNIHSFQKNEHNACILFIRDGTAVYSLVEQFYSARDVNYAIVSTFKILKTEKPEDVSLNIFSYIEVELSGKQSECTASQISGKMVKILYNSETFLTPLLDLFEHDWSFSRFNSYKSLFVFRTFYVVVFQDNKVCIWFIFVRPLRRQIGRFKLEKKQSCINIVFRFAPNNSFYSF